MNPQQDFQKLSPLERAEYVNSLLIKETSDHLKKVAANLDLNYGFFCKEMRLGGFTYSKAKNQYEKTLTLEEYKKIELPDESRAQTEADEVVSFIGNNLDQLKRMLATHQTELILDPQIYSSVESVTKTMVISKGVYDEFSNVCLTEFPHYRIKDLTSHCLLDFVKKYRKKQL